MIDFIPHKQLKAHVFPNWNSKGSPTWVVVLKSSFEYQIDGSVSALSESEALILADEYPNDNPEQYAPSAVSDLAPFKHGSEIIIYGHAFTSKPLAHFPVSVALTNNTMNWTKTLLVIGPRVWKKSLLGMIYSDPTPISELPIRYEYAYGGIHPNKEDDHYSLNPVGIGYAAKSKATGCSLPQIEQSEGFLKSPRQKVPPSGYGPLASHWEPRAQRFPEIDEQKLMEGGFPYVHDLPESLYNTAPEDQWLKMPLTGNACLTLTGLTKGLTVNEPLKLDWLIPEIQIQLTMREHSRNILLQADTLQVDTQKQRLHLIYRHAFEDLPERFQAQISVVEPELKDA